MADIPEAPPKPPTPPTPVAVATGTPTPPSATPTAPSGSPVSTITTGTGTLASLGTLGIRPTLTAVDPEQIITVNGQLGLFTPLSHQPNAAPDPTADQNLEIVVNSLKTEITGLQRDNAKLQAQLDATANPPRSPEDFAAAVQHSLDKLQSQLSLMTNPVCNFALKEFRLETNVHVDVSALGDVSYRFLQFNEKADPATISKIVLDVVPLPKTSTIGVFTQNLFQPYASVSLIEGLPADVINTLHQNQIDSLSDLLYAGTRARSNVALAALLNIDRVKLAGWLQAAELLTIQGVDGGSATVLIGAGITSLATLATLAPADLVTKLNAEVTALKRTDVKPLDEATATLWINAAKSYVGQSQS